jgi:hypothetical protein
MRFQPRVSRVVKRRLAGTGATLFQRDSVRLRRLKCSASEPVSAHAKAASPAHTSLDLNLVHLAMFRHYSCTRSSMYSNTLPPSTCLAGRLLREAADAAEVMVELRALNSSTITSLRQQPPGSRHRGRGRVRKRILCKHRSTACSHRHALAHARGTQGATGVVVAQHDDA